MKVGGIPQEPFFSIYENEEDCFRGIAFKSLASIKLPTDNEVISSMIEYYKDNTKPLARKPT
jgi:hypothetical protein